MNRKSGMTRREALGAGAVAAGGLGLGTRRGAARRDPTDDDQCHYQVDFVAGEPIETLGENPEAFYGRQERLIQYVHGSADGVTRRDTWINSLDPAVRRCLVSGWEYPYFLPGEEYPYIEVDGTAGVASVLFRVAERCGLTLSLAAYPLPNGEFSFGEEQDLFDATTRTFGPGIHRLEVALPCDRRGDATGIGEPTTLTEPGVYALTDDIEGGGIEVTPEASGAEILGNGHTIRGPGADPDNYGIMGRVSAEFSVRNVTVRGFDVGVFGRTYGGFTARNVTAVDNGSGFYCYDGLHDVVKSVARNNGSGFSFAASPGLLAYNRAIGNDGNGFASGGLGSPGTIVGNEATGNELGIGISYLRGKELDGNTVTDNEGEGLSVVGRRYPDPDRTTRISRTTARENGEGIILGRCTGVRLLDSVVERNEGDGVGLGGSNDNRIAGSTIRANGGDGVELVDSDGNVIADNVVCENAGEAIVLDDDSTGNVVRDNTREC